jgi:hypothetical protein
MWAEPRPETMAALRTALLKSDEMLETRGEAASV